MREVSKYEFYEVIRKGNLNVHPTIINHTYPYTSIWKYLNGYGKIFGKSEGKLDRGILTETYFISE